MRPSRSHRLHGANVEQSVEFGHLYVLLRASGRFGLNHARAPSSVLLLIFSPSNQLWYLHIAPSRPRPTRSRPSSFSSPPVRFHSPRTLRRHRRLQFNSPASYNSLCLTNDNVGDGIFEKLRVAESRADEQVAGGTGCDAVGD